MAPPGTSGDKPRKQGEQPQRVPSGKKQEDELQICDEPACTISFTPFAKHVKCFRHARCYDDEGRYNPLDCVECYEIFEALTDPDTERKWERAQSLIAWTKRGKKKYYKLVKKGKEPLPFFKSTSEF